MSFCTRLMSRPTSLWSKKRVERRCRWACISVRNLYRTDILTFARPLKWKKFPTRLSTTTPAKSIPILSRPAIFSATERSPFLTYWLIAMPTSKGTEI